MNSADATVLCDGDTVSQYSQIIVPSMISPLKSEDPDPAFSFGDS
jgi:hypothetical protein